MLKVEDLSIIAPQDIKSKEDMNSSLPAQDIARSIRAREMEQEKRNSATRIYLYDSTKRLMNMKANIML